MTARPGIVDLRDLASRRRWDPEMLAPRLEGAGLVAEDEVVRRLGPPRVIVTVVPYDQAWMLERTRRWLSASEHVVVCRDLGSVEDMAADPEQLGHYEEEWRGATEGLARVEIVDDFATALARAEEAARTLEPRAEAEAAPPVAIDELPASPWDAFAAGLFDWNFLERIQRRGREIAIGPEVPLPWGTPEEARAYQRRNPGFKSLGSDPVHRPVGWRGGRMNVYWTWDGMFFTASDHDYPCGPGKKLYGFKDNDPVEVTLAPDASMYAARFDHDVLVTRAVPLPWRRAGAFDVVLQAPDPYRAVFYAQDPEKDERWPRLEDIDDEDGRDEAPALVLAPDRGYALDLSRRVYRIMNTGHDEGAERVHVGGPDEGFAVFDGEHRLVRRARGRLLGGWYRYATIEEDDAYWREDLVSGARARIAPVDLAISEDPEIEAVARDAMLEGQFDRARELRSRGAVRSVVGDEPIRVYALPQTKNVLLVAKEHVRVI